jgi:hypothetical protein
MLSEKKLAANKLNAQKSTGPKTPQGKAKVSQNAVTHGLTSHRPVLDMEDTAEFRTFVNEMLDQLDPTNPLEFFFAKRAACQAWRIQRAQCYETLVLDRLVNNVGQASPLGNKNDKTNPIDTVGADHRVCPDDSTTRPPKTKITDYIEVDPGLFGEDDDPKALLGQAIMDDFRNHWTLDKIARYETRLEGSMMRCLTKFQKVRESKMMNFTGIRQYYRGFQPRPQDFQDTPNVGQASSLGNKVGEASVLHSENDKTNPIDTVGTDPRVCPDDPHKSQPSKENPDQNENEQNKPKPYPDRVRRCQSDTEAPSVSVLPAVSKVGPSKVEGSAGTDDSIYSRIENDPNALPMDSFKHWKILHCAPRGETIDIDDGLDIPAVLHRPDVPERDEYVFRKGWHHQVLRMVNYPWEKRCNLTESELNELVDSIIGGFPNPAQFLWDFDLIELTAEAAAKRRLPALAS